MTRSVSQSIETPSHSLVESLSELPIGSSVYRCRYMVRSDLRDVCAIEQLVFEYPWDAEEFVNVMRQRTIVAYVAEQLVSHKTHVAKEVIGYVVYEVFSDSLSVMNIAVHPKNQRSGVGSALLRMLKRRIQPEARQSISAYVRESNVDALNFLKHEGFRACRLIKRYWQESDDDAVVMEYRNTQEAGSGL